MFSIDNSETVIYFYDDYFLIGNQEIYYIETRNVFIEGEYLFIQFRNKEFIIKINPEDKERILEMFTRKEFTL